MTTCSRTFSVYLTSNLSINIRSFHPALLLNRKHPPTRSCSRRPPNPKGLRRSTSMATSNLISTIISPLNRIIRVRERILSSRSPRSIREAITKHSCLRLNMLILAIPTKAEGDFYFLTEPNNLIFICIVVYQPRQG
jgi:hypothetical protein